MVAFVAPLNSFTSANVVTSVVIVWKNSCENSSLSKWPPYGLRALKLGIRDWAAGAAVLHNGLSTVECLYGGVDCGAEEVVELLGVGDAWGSGRRYVNGLPVVRERCEEASDCAVLPSGYSARQGHCCREHLLWVCLDAVGASPSRDTSGRIDGLCCPAYCVSGVDHVWTKEAESLAYGPGVDGVRGDPSWDSFGRMRC